MFINLNSKDQRLCFSLYVIGSDLDLDKYSPCGHVICDQEPYKGGPAQSE